MTAEPQESVPPAVAVPRVLHPVTVAAVLACLALGAATGSVAAASATPFAAAAVVLTWFAIGACSGFALSGST